jgi:tRNA pseudouridine38-40 synthase
MDLTFKKALEDKNREAMDHLLHKNVVLRRSDETLSEGVNEVLDTLINERYPKIKKLYTYENITMIEFYNALAVKLKFRNTLISRLYFDYIDNSVKRLRMDIAYDGTLYNGFQRQPKKSTIQGAIEKVLGHLTGESITITPSGRTDKGVHALKQVVHFDTASPLPLEKIKTLMNRMLPTDITINLISEVPRLFHARFDVQRKIYHYTITHKRDPFQSHYALYHGPIDIDKFNKTLHLFEGVHDFEGFTKKTDGAVTLRSVHTCKAVRSENETVVIVESEGFLRHMVRYMVGTALRDHDKQTRDVEKALRKPHDSHVYLAPGQGLSLYDVLYTID